MKESRFRRGRGAREGRQGPPDAPRLPAGELAELVLRAQQGDVEARNAALVELLPTIRGAVGTSLRRLGLAWEIEEIVHQVLPAVLRALETWRAGGGAAVRTWVGIRVAGEVRSLSVSSRYRDGSTGINPAKIRRGEAQRTWREADARDAEASEAVLRLTIEDACCEEWRKRQREDRGDLLAAALAACPVERRELLRLLAEEGCTQQEIARRMGIHFTYVHQLVHGLTPYLRPALEEFRRRPRSA